MASNFDVGIAKSPRRNRNTSILENGNVFAAIWMKIENKEASRWISISGKRARTGSFHLLQLSREATCWVKPKATCEHRVSWEIHFILEEMLVGQMNNSV